MAVNIENLNLTGLSDNNAIAGDKKLPKCIPQDVNEADFVKHRIFYSYLDTFNAKYFAAFITDQIYGAAKLLPGMDEGGGEEAIAEVDPNQPQFKYEIIGTVEYTFRTPTEDILFLISESEPEKVKNELMKCGVIIFDITQNEGQIQKALDTLTMIEEELSKIKEIGPKTFASYTTERIFVLISTVMTWGKTKPLNPKNPNFVFNDGHFRKRKPHPNYERHLACENEVMLIGRKYPDLLKTYVVCSGIIYGEEEQDLMPLFKLAWKNEPYLPCFMPGDNVLPVIHIMDLSRVIHKLIEINPGQPQFILAVEPNSTTLYKFISTLSKTMGSGHIKFVSDAEVFLYKDLNQSLLDRCTVNLKMEPEVAYDTLQVDFGNQIQNMKLYATEFVEKQNLVAKKVILHGPPAVGKTTWAKKIEEKYGLHYINIGSMIENIIETLRQNIDLALERAKEVGEKGDEKVAPEGEEEEIEEEENEAGNIDEWRAQLREISDALESPNKRLPDDMVIRLLKKYLMNNVCQYIGYVLDGYPKNYIQAKELFALSAEPQGEEAAGEEDEGVGGEMTSKILPNYVISLQASDQFLQERVMRIPESEILGTHYVESEMLRRLALFRADNAEDDTVLNYFDEVEIYPIIINVEDPAWTDDCIIKQVEETLGAPATFLLTIEEELELNKLKVQFERAEAEKKTLQRKIEEHQCQSEFQNKMEHWADLLQKYQQEEEKMLIAKAEPLRNYLVKFVFPVLIKGLAETAKVKPPDPLTFLAEFLFKENPEGKMFDPSYTLDGEQLLEEYEEVEETLETNIPGNAISE